MKDGVAYAAEELVRSGGGSSITWQGVRLTTHFQPIYCARRGTAFGFEALARANGGTGQALEVEEFFGGVEEEDRSLLDWTCRALHMRNFATVDPGDRVLFINVHPEAAVKDVRRGRELGEMIGYYGLVPERLCVEITQAPCSDEGLLREAVDGYRDLGASVAIDDFGFGRSDFDRVMRLRPDLVKVDLAAHGRAIGAAEAVRKLPGMVELLHESRAKVVVEGVESRTEALLAVGARADYLQGFYFAHPQPKLAPEFVGASMLDALLKAPSRPHAIA